MTAPIDGYDQMTVGEVDDAVSPYTNGLDSIQDPDVLERLDLLNEILSHERDNKDRKTAKESITDVRDEVREEANDRDLLTQEEADDHERETATSDDAETDSDDGDEADDNDSSDPDDGAADTDDSDDPEDEDADDESDESADEEDDGAIELREGADGSTRVLVRNADRKSKRVAGFSFNEGEVKDVVLNDRVRGAIERNELQVVKG